MIEFKPKSEQPKKEFDYVNESQIYFEGQLVGDVDVAPRDGGNTYRVWLRRDLACGIRIFGFGSTKEAAFDDAVEKFAKELDADREFFLSIRSSTSTKAA